MATVAPRDASSLAMAAPIPLQLPVTSAILSWSSIPHLRFHSANLEARRGRFERIPMIEASTRGHYTVDKEIVRMIQRNSSRAALKIER